MLSSEIILIHDPDGRILQANPAAQEVLGYSTEELEGMSILELVLTSEEEMWERVDRTERGEIRFRARHRRKDGSTFESEVRVRRIEVEGHELIVGVGKDITDQRLAKMLNESLDQISSEIGSRLDFDEVMRSTVSNARRAIGADSATIALHEDGGWVVRYQDGFPQPQELTEAISRGMNASRIVERTGRTLVVNDVLHDPRMNHELAVRFSIRSLLVIPLKMRERLVGLLAFFCHRQDGIFSDAQVDFANKLAHSISLLLENARLTELEMTTEHYLQGVVDTVPDAIIAFDAAGRFTFANREAEKILDLPREEILSRYHDDPRWNLREVGGEPFNDDTPFRRVMKAREAIHGLEFKVRRGDQDVVLSINMTPLFGPDGRITGAIASLTDITSRKASEEKLELRRHQLEVLTEVSNQVNSQLHTGGVMRSLVAAGMALVGATAGSAGLFVDGRMVFTEYNDRGKLVPIDLSFPKGYGVPGWIIATRKPYLTNEARVDPHVVPEVREKLRFRNLIEVPILNGKGDLLGCFELHNKAGGGPFTRDDVAILEGLASSAAVAMENARTVEQKVRYEGELRKQKRDYQTVFESVPALIAIKDTQDRAVMANRMFRETFGLTPETVGKWVIGPAPERKDHYRSDLEVMQERKPLLGILERTRNARGEEIWLLTDKVPYLDNRGNVIGVIMFSRDITEQRRIREQLVQEMEYMSTLMETTPSGIVLIYQNGHILFANRSAETILGIDRAEITRRRFDSPEWKITDYEGRPFPLEDQPFSRVMASGQPVSGVRYAIQWPDGRRVMLLLNAAPVCGDGGEVTGVIVSMEDVTAMVLAEKALEESLRTSDDIVQQIPSGMLIFQYRPPDHLNLMSVNATADKLLGGIDHQVGRDLGQIWKDGSFFATKEEFMDVVRKGTSLRREGVHYSDRVVDGIFTFRAFFLPGDRLCVNFDDITDRMFEADLRRQAYEQIENNIERFATLVDRIRNPLSAIIARAEGEGGETADGIIARAGEIEDILKQLDQGWLESEKVRAFLKKSL